MGIDKKRFVDALCDEVMCTICHNVLEDPVALSPCKHVFCLSCIFDHFGIKGRICPIDDLPVDKENGIRQVPPSLGNRVANLEIGCENAKYGCKKYVCVANMKSHMKKCKYRYTTMEFCKLGCNMLIPQSAVSEHNCIAEMRATVTKQQQDLDAAVSQLEKYKKELSMQEQDVMSLESMVKNWEAKNANARKAYSQMQRSNLKKWGSKLSFGRVKTWNSLITSPPLIVQRMVRRTLAEAACPETILKSLMEACVEWEWPMALNTSHARNLFAVELTQLVLRRVPGKQAVIVLPTDNKHMEHHFILDKGYIIIFQSGVETI